MPLFSVYVAADLLMSSIFALFLVGGTYLVCGKVWRSEKRAKFVSCDPLTERVQQWRIQNAWLNEFVWL
jgi:hypothetical protein